MSDLLGLTHHQQQQAVERINALRQQGFSMAEAMQRVIAELKQQHSQTNTPQS
ncbi:MAG: YoaH family protein [Ferrimonas sp.]